MRAKFTLNNDLSGGFITLRGDSSDISTLSFYDFLASANRDEENPGFIGIDLVLDGADTTPTPGDTLARAPFDLVTGNEYIMEATAVGPHLSLKAWAVGDEEPDQPQVSVIDHTLTSGKIGLASYNCPTDGGGDVLSTSWDDITFTPSNSAFAAHASSMATVPEPSTVSLVALSLVGVFGLRRRRLLG